MIRKKALSYGLIQYNEMNYSINVTKGMFASFLIYSFTYVLYFMIFFIDFKNILPSEVHVYSLLFSHFSSLFNPFLFGMTNLLFNKGYKYFLYYIGLRRNRSNSIV